MEAKNISLTINPSRSSSVLSFDIYDEGKRVDSANIGGVIGRISDDPTEEEIRDIVELELRNKENVVKRRTAERKRTENKKEKIDNLNVPNQVTKTSKPKVDVTVDGGTDIQVKGTVSSGKCDIAVDGVSNSYTGEDIDETFSVEDGEHEVIIAGYNLLNGDRVDTKSNVHTVKTEQPIEEEPVKEEQTETTSPDSV